MLRIQLSADDLGRVRFAPAAAPVLEAVLMLFELRNRPHAAPTGRDDWRMRVRTRFPDEARPLLNLIPSCEHVLLLDVLTTDAEEAFNIAARTPDDVNERNLAAVERMTPDGPSAWLRGYFHRDPRVMEPLDGALRTFHKAHLVPYWPPVLDRFDEDVDYRTTMMREQGVAAMLESLHPNLHLDGSTLYAPYPGEREVELGGRGLILMPSMFWTGRPLVTWDPQDPSRNVLIYPAKPVGTTSAAAGDGVRASIGYDSDVAEPTAALAKLMGPTRAAILNRLRRPDTTSGLARDLGISPSSASDHTAALRDAGLITSRRTGQSVEHRLTRLGRSLLVHARTAPGY